MIANHDDGGYKIYSQNYLNTLILSLDSPLLASRTATLDFLLATVTLEYPKGHQFVMGALEYFKVQRKYKRVFDCLIEFLGSSVTSRGIFGSTVGSAQEYSIFGFVTDKIKDPTEREIRDYLVLFN